MQKRSLNTDSDLDDMDPMMINDNNDDLMPDDDVLAEQLRTSGKPPLWQVELLERAVNDNAASVDAANLNESDASTQPCRNSIQVNFNSKQSHVTRWSRLNPLVTHLF